MKLRNKKTGETVDFQPFRFYQTDSGKFPSEIYESLSALNEEWEDYKEPLINDEGARGSVHSWASAQHIHKVECKKEMRGPDVEAVTFEASGLYPAPIIEFICLDADVTDGGIYTIEELCGEEEE